MWGVWVSNFTLDRSVGSRSLAAAGQRSVGQTGILHRDNEAATGGSYTFTCSRWLAVRTVVTQLVTVVALLVSAALLTAEAQQRARVPRIGVLGGSSTSPAHALLDGLRELGYVEGRTITIDWRWARGDEQADAAELVRLKVDAMVAVTNPAIEAALKQTKTIPIVMVLASDPVGDRFVLSLARPGGNITGLTTLGPDLAGKRLPLFKEAIPTLSRLVLLWDPAGRQQSVTETEMAARRA